jgi:hypothetical protein
MAIYPIWNPETGETKVIEMSVHEITAWYESNKPWTRNWAEGCAGFAETGEWKDKLGKKHPGWKEMLNRFSKIPGSKVEKI